MEKKEWKEIRNILGATAVFVWLFPNVLSPPYLKFCICWFKELWIKNSGRGEQQNVSAGRGCLLHGPGDQGLSWFSKPTCSCLFSVAGMKHPDISNLGERVFTFPSFSGYHPFLCGSQGTRNFKQLITSRSRPERNRLCMSVLSWPSPLSPRPHIDEWIQPTFRLNLSTSAKAIKIIPSRPAQHWDSLLRWF